ncbi:hypothetical protein F7725_019462 [Dissostichus mawsoni]|uniref:Uncharacterized protein n=1 Tax=Dissostichus mawsoni TaxID=36200 RepID=A0A7J5YKP2_DISMA|nr:hypothetical protein F7725_019462 [Dissostichus mawsoni]
MGIFTLAFQIRKHTINRNLLFPYVEKYFKMKKSDCSQQYPGESGNTHERPGGCEGWKEGGSPTNNVSPTSTPAKSVPTLQPPPGEVAAAAAAAPAEPAEDSLLDLDPLSSSGPTGASSAAPTSWGEMGDSLLSEPTLTAEPASSTTAATPTPAAAEPGVSLAPPTSTAAATSTGAANMDLLGDAFSTPAPAPEAPAAAAEGGAAATSAPAAANAGADPFAPSDSGTNAASSGLDLFGMMTVDNNNLGSSLDACFNSVVPQPSPSPSPSPLFTSTPSTISTPQPFQLQAPPTLRLTFSANPQEEKPQPLLLLPPVLSSLFDGLGDVMKPTLTPQGGMLTPPWLTWQVISQWEPQRSSGGPHTYQMANIVPYCLFFFSHKPGAPGATMMSMARPGPGAPCLPERPRAPESLHPRGTLWMTSTLRTSCLSLCLELCGWDVCTPPTAFPSVMPHPFSQPAIPSTIFAL